MTEHWQLNLEHDFARSVDLFAMRRTNDKPASEEEDWQC